MKKFVSMAMVAAMTTSMVPATAFAAGDVTTTIKVVDDLELTKDEDSYTINEANYAEEVPELQFKVTGVDYRNTEEKEPEAEVTLTFDNAELIAGADAEYLKGLIEIEDEDGNSMLYTEGEEATEATEEAFEEATPATYAELEDLTVVKEADLSADTAYEVVGDATAILEKLQAKGDVIEEATLSEAVGETTIDVDASLITGASSEQLVLFDAEGEVVATVAAWDTATSAVVKDTDDILATLEAGGEIKWMNAAGDAVGSNSLTDVVTVTINATDYDLTNSTHIDTLVVDGAEVVAAFLTQLGTLDYKIGEYTAPTEGTEATEGSGIEVEVYDIDEDEFTFKLIGELEEDWVVSVDLESVMDKTSKGKTATVSVDGDLGEVDDLVYVSVLGQGITASTKKLANVAEEEKTKLEKDLVIEAAVGTFDIGQKIELKLNSGFEFGTINTDDNGTYQLATTDEDNIIELTVKTETDEIKIDASHIEIKAEDAKSGDVAVLKIKTTTGFNGTTSVEVAKVVDYVVTMSVEEDEDVPVIYSGVNVENYGITDDSDHMSLEVTIEESFPGAWSMRQGFNLELPDGVYVTDIDVTEAANFEYEEDEEADTENWREAFWNAYIEGEHKGFEFDKRVFNDVDTDLAEDCAELTFQLELVADPGFVGDVNLKLTGDLVDEQEVTVAKFATPFYVTAEQNDLKIDYRYTDIPTEITITETEAGLWDADKASFGFYIEDGHMRFEEDPTYTVDDASNMELDKDEIVEFEIDGTETDVLFFTVDEESDEAATITISDMQLYMERNIPAGPYDLEIMTSMGAMYNQEVLFAPDAEGKVNHIDTTDDLEAFDSATPFVERWAATDDIYASRPDTSDVKKDSYIDDVEDYSTTVKEAFVNVVTAGREQDDASFTTKVVVPVGEAYIVSGENTVELDVPAYISAAGYTMLPVRAVANALGINNNNVIWNGETKTVTILYGQRIITMVAGQKVINVNGSAIPASAAVEIVDGRTFLPMRDLATALGVTDITWDAATKTATLNGGVVAE